MIDLKNPKEKLKELTPILDIESLDKDIVNLLIEKILIHGENDIEIVWYGRFEGGD